MWRTRRPSLVLYVYLIEVYTKFLVLWHVTFRILVLYIINYIMWSYYRTSVKFDLSHLNDTSQIEIQWSIFKDKFLRIYFIVPVRKHVNKYTFIMNQGHQSNDSSGAGSLFNLYYRLEFSFGCKAWTFDSCIIKYSTYCKNKQMTKHKTCRSVYDLGSLWMASIISSLLNFFRIYYLMKFPKNWPLYKSHFYVSESEIKFTIVCDIICGHKIWNISYDRYDM